MALPSELLMHLFLKWNIIARRLSIIQIKLKNKIDFNIDKTETVVQLKVVISNLKF